MPQTLEAGMHMQWRRRPAGDPARAATLAGRLGVHPLIADLLAARGVDQPDVAAGFLEPKLAALHDPATLPGIDAATRRILKATADRQRIVIYADYDVDGVTAAAILYHTLTALGAQVTTYVPHRIDEGYGLNSDAIRQIAEGEHPLIVTVDCGITACEPARVARECGADLIITDHHHFDPADLPDACALVHPRLNDDYPFGELCGAGVAFKLAWHIARTYCGSDRVPQVMRDLLLDLLSLAALGTVADVVPLVGENRIITAFGLGQIKRTRFAGLNAMIDAASLRDEKIDAYHVGFVLGPRLNACGRMGHARDAVRLLITDDAKDAADIATFLTKENERRRATEKQIFNEAKQMVIDQGCDSPDCRAIVVGNEGWHAGVIGIVASRLVEAFARPVVMLSYDSGEAHGSARSVDGVSIHDALSQCADMLTSFGGHAMAAGMRLPVDGVDAFRDRLIEQVNTMLSPDELTTSLDIDGGCALADVSLEMVDQLNRLAPFGRSNPHPVFCVSNVWVAQGARRVGSTGAHLKFAVTDGDRYVQAIAFGMGELAPDLHAGCKLDVAFEPRINEWQGRRSAEMRVLDLRLVR
jgi:single-stranded-DNA-specific exonuclease